MQTHIIQAPIPAAVIPAFSPDRWLYQIFSPLAVAAGGPLRCNVAEVEANIGRERFLQEVKLRGYRAMEDAGMFTLALNREPLRVMI
ncbi:MAG: N-(5'-phosphoribosyl)anthranilate isomerase [Cypionkella sp.]